MFERGGASEAGAWAVFLRVARKYPVKGGAREMRGGASGPLGGVPGCAQKLETPEKGEARHDPEADNGVPRTDD